MTNPYLFAHYKVDIFKDPILIGQETNELEKLLQKENASTWAFITAYNPMSVVLSPEENENRNLELQEKVKSYKYFHGEGRDPSGEWIPERSILILDISRQDAIALAMEFEQKAIVYGEKGKVAELIMIKH